MKTIHTILILLFSNYLSAQIKQKNKLNFELAQSMGSGINWNSTLQMNMGKNYFVTINIGIYNPVAKNKPDNYYHRYSSGGLISKKTDQQDNSPIDKHKFEGISIGKKYYFSNSFITLEPSVGLANMRGSYLIFINKPYSVGNGGWFPTYDSSNYTVNSIQYQNVLSFQSRLKFYGGAKNRRVKIFVELESQLNKIKNSVIIGVGLQCRFLSFQ
jgi:hypothetical protein